MVNDFRSRGNLLPHVHLLALSVGVVVACFATVAAHRGQTISVVPEVIIPLAFGTAMGLFSVKLYWHDYDSELVQTIVKCSWAGGLIASAVGGWWVVLHYYLAMPTVGLPEQILTLVSGGIGAGLVVGYARTDTTATTDGATDRVLVQKSWAQQPGQTPILHTIVDAVAELEEKNAVDLEPVHTHINTDIFRNLRTHGGSPWQIQFYVDDYVIEVSSTGTVTSYEAKTPSGDVRIVITSNTDADPTQ